MTPQVFISHASEDKKRLEPYISRLLMAFEDIVLWIDTPEKIKVEFGIHNVRLRIALDRPDPSAMRPERDEIFLEALAKADPLDFWVPHTLRDFLSGIRDSFLAREWAGLTTCVLYVIATPFLVPWPSDGPLTTGAFLPLFCLPLAFLSVLLAPRAALWARDRVRQLLSN